MRTYDTFHAFFLNKDQFKHWFFDPKTKFKLLETFENRLIGHNLEARVLNKDVITRFLLPKVQIQKADVSETDSLKTESEDDKP